jgi:SSS family solute:Na+ symporter
VIAGIVAGELTVVFLTVTSATIATLLPSAPQVVKDLNVGFVALGVNVVVLGVVALATRGQRQATFA